MGIVEMILLGIGLAMDCFAVSLSKGIAAKNLFPGKVTLMALLFGLFQAGMPLIGYYAGSHFAEAISKVAPWVALILLGFIGGKMIKEHFSPEEEEGNADYGIMTLLVLSVATSIDALATGLIFVGNSSRLALAVLIIGICSFAFSLAGSFTGVFVGKKFRFPAELVGGLILVGIGIKIFLEGML